MGWGGAKNVQVHLHTYWMLSLLAHTNILPATLETFSPALTHILLFTLETSSLAHTYILPAMLETSSLALTHILHFTLETSSLAHTHILHATLQTFFVAHTHILPASLYTFFIARTTYLILRPIDIFSCTYIYTYILYATLQFYRCLLLHIHTEEKKRSLKLCPVKLNVMLQWVFKIPGIFKVQF